MKSLSTSRRNKPPRPLRESRIPFSSAKVDQLIYRLNSVSRTESLPLLERVLDKHPQHRNARMAYAEALRADERSEEASRESQRAVSLLHERDPNWLVRAANTIVWVDVEVAEEYIRQAYSRARDFKGDFVLQYAAYNVEGVVAFRREQFTEAERLFLLANSLEPGSSKYPFLVAQLLEDYGLTDAAREMLIQESAKYTSPEFSNVRDRFQRAIDGIPTVGVSDAVADTMMRRSAWMKAAELVLAQPSVNHHIRCPVNDDGELDVEWLPYSGNAHGKCRLYCLSCGQHISILIDGKTK